MKRGLMIVAGVALGVSAANGPAVAQETAVKLSKADLLELMPGQKVMHVSKAGNTRHWTNEADGSLFASWAPIITGSGKFGGSGKGTWNISDDGRYCVKIDWTRAPKSGAGSFSARATTTRWAAPTIRRRSGKSSVCRSSPRRRLAGSASPSFCMPHAGCQRCVSLAESRGRCLCAGRLSRSEGVPE